jgi:hypothetical protein
MATQEIYQASTTAPVNIAVVKYLPLPLFLPLRFNIATGIGGNETQN